MLVSPLTFAFLIACAPKMGAAGAPKGVDLDHYAGVWEDSGGAITVIERSKNSLAVMSVVDYDDEFFEIKSFGWEGDVFGWDYHVPSTGYDVQIRVLSTDGNNMMTSWANAFDDGQEGLVRQ